MAWKNEFMSIDFNSSTWVELRKILREKHEDCVSQLKSFHTSFEHTQALRGRVELIEDLLSLEESDSN